jgi:hypothetical protein
LSVSEKAYDFFRAELFEKVPSSVIKKPRIVLSRCLEELMLVEGKRVGDRARLESHS